MWPVRLCVYDSDSGVCDGINMRTNVKFQISPSTNSHKKSLASAPLIIRQIDNRRATNDMTIFSDSVFEDIIVCLSKATERYPAVNT